MTITYTPPETQDAGMSVGAAFVSSVSTNGLSRLTPRLRALQPRRPAPRLWLPRRPAGRRPSFRWPRLRLPVRAYHPCRPVRARRWPHGPEWRCTGPAAPTLAAANAVVFANGAIGADPLAAGFDSVPLSAATGTQGDTVAAADAFFATLGADFAAVAPSAALTGALGA